MTVSARADSAEPQSAGTSGATTLESLARTARQVALYGPDHPAAVNALYTACRELEAATFGGMLQVRAEPEGLLWNGSLLESRNGNVARFHRSMRDRLISSIDISAKLRSSDLARLLMVLAMDPEELSAQGGVYGVFGTDVNSTIRIEKVDFTGEMLVSEAVWGQLCQAISLEEASNLRELICSCAGAPTRGDLKSPAQVFDVDESGGFDHEKESASEVVAAGIARLIQRAGEASYFTDPDAWQAWRETTARQIESLPARWRSLIFRATCGISSEYPDMLALIASEMSVSDCVSLVLDHPDSIRAERSDMLSLALERILADRQRRNEVQQVLHDEAIKRGVPEAVYQNVVGLLMSQFEGGQGSISNAPSFQPMSDFSEHTGIVEQNLDDLFSTLDAEIVRISRLHMLQEALDTRLTISQYGTVISLLTKASEECAGHNDVERLTSVISTLAKETGEKNRDAGRRAVAASAIVRASTDSVVSCLKSALDEATEDIASGIIYQIGFLGEPGMSALTDVIRTGRDTHVATAMQVMLMNDGATLSHVRDILADAHGLTLKRALRHLIEIRGEGAAEKITAAIADAGENTSLRVIELIRGGNRSDLGRALIPMLDDPSGMVRIEAVMAIADLNVSEAVPSVCRLVEDESSFGEGGKVREAAVRALGELQVGIAVPTLCAVLRGRAFLSKLAGRKARIAAAEALASIGGADSKDALERGCRSLQPGVRDACRRALSRLIVNERTIRRGSGGY